jgi:hypothetical protein
MLRVAISAVAALAVVMVMGLIPAFSQEGKPAGGEKIDFEKIQADLMKFHTPGKEHQYLQSWVGDYTIEGKMWMPGNDKPTEVKGWSHISKVNDAFVQEKMTMVMPGNVKMSGEGYFGYDNDSKTYQTTWVMTGSTTQRMMTGIHDPGTDSMEFKCSYDCPVTHLKITERITSRPTEDGKMVVTIFMKAGDFPEMKHMERIYTRLN